MTGVAAAIAHNATRENRNGAHRSESSNNAATIPKTAASTDDRDRVIDANSDVAPKRRRVAVSATTPENSHLRRSWTAARPAAPAT
jgi:hypothetical protein